MARAAGGGRAGVDRPMQIRVSRCAELQGGALVAVRATETRSDMLDLQPATRSPRERVVPPVRHREPPGNSQPWNGAPRAENCGRGAGGGVAQGSALGSWRGLLPVRGGARTGRAAA